MNRYLARPHRCPCRRPSGSAALPSAVLTASYTDVPYHIYLYFPYVYVHYVYVPYVYFPYVYFPYVCRPHRRPCRPFAALTAHRRAAPSRCILYQIYLPCMVFPILLRLSR